MDQFYITSAKYLLYFVSIFVQSVDFFDEITGVYEFSYRLTEASVLNIPTDAEVASSTALHSKVRSNNGGENDGSSSIFEIQLSDADALLISIAMEARIPFPVA